MKLSSILIHSGLFVLPSVLVAMTFSDWQAANFIPTQLAIPAIVGQAGDPDADGLVNLHEYAFLGRPLLSDSNLAPVVQVVNGRLTLVYRERHGLTDVSIRLQGSDTLFNWITYNSVTEADREVFTGYDEVTLIDPEPFVQNRRFLRLQVELLPIEEPRTPVQLSLNVVTATNWSLAWTDPNTTETAYAIERLLPTHVWERLATLGADTGNWQHASANYQTSMTYRVVAIGADGREAVSEPISLADSDGDGIPDALELGSAYAGAYGTYASRPDVYSTSGSGVSDGWLAANGFDPKTHDTSLDTDGDGLSDAEEAARGTDPRKSDTDGDGVPDSEDGWPRHAWITTAPLPDVYYAVVRLKAIGWPANAVAAEIDDACDILGYQANSPIFLKTGASQPVTVPITVASSLSNNLIPSGHVVGSVSTISDYNDSGLLSPSERFKSNAATWSPAGGMVTSSRLSDGFSFGGKGRTYDSGSRVVDMNQAGDLITQQITLVGVAYYREDDPGPIYTTGSSGSVGGAIYSSGSGRWLGPASQQNLSWIDDVWRYANNLSPWDGILFDPPKIGYAPVSINNAGVVAAMTILQNDAVTSVNWSPGETEGSTPVVIDGTTVHTIEQSSDLRVHISRITSGDPVVAYGYQNSNPSLSEARMWWAHQDGEKWKAEILVPFDPLEAIQPAVSGNWYRGAINDRLEIITDKPVKISDDVYSKIPQIIRNGVTRPIDSSIPKGWTVTNAKDINNHGVILAQATRTLDDQGLPISNPQSEPVLLLPISLTMDTNQP